MPIDHSPSHTPNDPVAARVEGHLRSMKDAGYGAFHIERDGSQILLAFGRVEARGETYDVALLRLASALLDSHEYGGAFLARMRNPSHNPPAANLRDNYAGVRKAAGKR